MRFCIEVMSLILMMGKSDYLAGYLELATSENAVIYSCSEYAAVGANPI